MNIDVDRIHDALPDHLQNQWDELLAETLRDGGPLTICLVGAFSSGKSSLLNMLLEERILPTGQTETTAIPTFLEYGDDWTFGHGRDESWESIERETFEQLAERPAEQGEFATVEAPAEWLRDFTVVDLPGLASRDANRTEMTRAQIASSDVVLYLLQKRGPTRSDVEALSEAARRGKHIIVTVSHWDEVQRAVEQRDQKPVDLGTWEEQIRDETGLDVDILPVSHDGIGREELKSRLTGLTDETSKIRQRRFASRAETIVEQAIQEHDSRLESLEAESQEDIERLRNSIQEKRSELNALKSDLYEERREHRDRLREKFQQAKESTLDSLEARVADSREALENDPNEDAWETYVDDLNQAGRNALTDLTERVDELLDEALDVSDLDADWSELQFQFPSPPDVEPDTWFDAADAERLKSQLEEVEDELEELESQDDTTSVDGGQRQELIGRLRELKQARRQIANREPPKQRVESSAGREVGRNIGHVADAALMFVDPTTIASKAASIVGKGASIAKGVVNTDKVSKGLKFLQKSDRTENIAKGLQKASQKIDKFDPDAFRDKATRVAEAAQQQKMGERLNETGKKLGKLGFLQVLSVSYWTEKIGGMFDSLKDTKLEVDREALEEQRQALEQVNEQIRAIETELNDLEQQARQDRLSDYERKVKKREKRELEDELAKQQELAEQQRREIEEEREQLLQERVQQEADRAIQRARKRLIDEIRGIENQLGDTFEQYWEESIEESLKDKKAHLQELHDSLEEVPEERDRHIDQVKSQLEVLREQRSSLQDVLTR